MLTQLPGSQLDSCRENASRSLAEFAKCLEHQDLPDDLSKPSKIPSDVSYLGSWLTSTAHLPPEWKKAENDRSEKKTFTETLRKALETWRSNTQAQKDLDALIPRLEKALEIAEEERRQFTDGVLAGIAAEVGRLYEIVHPGEGLNKISLQLDSSKRASLDLGTIFAGQNTSPQAYFSDSHLDTLGLCIFIALSSLDGAENTTLVLDDVLASVDEPHVERVIEMLYAEAAKFRHTVITTHYRPWKEKYRWGWLKNGQCQFVELKKWTNQAGLTLTRSVPDVDRLRELLAESAPDTQLICAKAGVILEAALDFRNLAERVAKRCPPEQARLFNSYTFDAFAKSLVDRFRAAIPDPFRPPAGYRIVTPRRQDYDYFLDTHNFRGVNASSWSARMRNR